MVLKQLVANKGDAQWMGIPGIERAASGALWVSAFAGGPKEPDDENRILTFTSIDDGATWSAPTVQDDPPDETRAFDPTLWVSPRGDLYLIRNRGNCTAAEHGIWLSVNSTPDDTGSSFGEPWQLDVGVPYAFRMNKPTVTSWGEWLLPVTFAREPVHSWFAGDSQLQGVAISTDGFRTCRFHGAVQADPWALENMIAERMDGTLWMLIRGGGGVIWESVSTDRGRTWSAGRRTSIANPGSRFCIRRLQSGRLLLINSPLPDARTSIVAQLSEDDGHTWSSPLVLDDRPGVSYPDASQAPDGRIFAVHDRDRQGAGEVILSMFTEDDVLRAR